jgi:hypothetical protein
VNEIIEYLEMAGELVKESEVDDALVAKLLELDSLSHL